MWRNVYLNFYEDILGTESWEKIFEGMEDL